MRALMKSIANFLMAILIIGGSRALMEAIAIFILMRALMKSIANFLMAILIGGGRALMEAIAIFILAISIGGAVALTCGFGLGLCAGGFITGLCLIIDVLIREK